MEIKSFCSCCITLSSWVSISSCEACTAVSTFPGFSPGTLFLWCSWRPSRKGCSSHTLCISSPRQGIVCYATVLISSLGDALWIAHAYAVTCWLCVSLHVKVCFPGCLLAQLLCCVHFSSLPPTEHFSLIMSLVFGIVVNYYCFCGHHVIILFHS